MSEVKAAEAGTVCTVDGNDWEVKPKCAQNSGVWFCATHMVGFPTQIAKDSHIASGEHVLAWFCHAHGDFETP